MTPLAFAFGTWELGIFLLVILLLFGSRMPKMARALGQSFAELRRGVNSVLDPEDEERKKP